MGIIPVNRMVGWTYARSYQKVHDVEGVRVMVNFDALLPDTYGMKAADLTALMEAWRQRAVAHHRAA